MTEHLRSNARKWLSGARETMRGLLILALFAVPARAQRASGGAFDAAQNPVGGGGGFASGGGFGVFFTMGPAAPPAFGGAFSAAGAGGGGCGPTFTLQNLVAQSVQDPTGVMTLTLPAFAVNAPNFDLVFRRDPVGNPVIADPSVILAANGKLAAGDGSKSPPATANIWEMDIMDCSGIHGGALGAAGTLAFAYKADAYGNVLGTSPPVRAKTLSVWLLDEANAQWVKVPDSSVDSVNRRVVAPIRHLSVYALIGGGDPTVSDVYAYPVPFRPFGPNAGTGAGQTGTEAAGITFANLPSEGTIDLYTLSGRLVRHLDIPANLAPAKLGWDAKNSDGASVVSGAYVWRVASGSNSKTGKLVIIK